MIGIDEIKTMAASYDVSLRPSPDKLLASVGDEVLTITDKASGRCVTTNIIERDKQCLSYLEFFYRIVKPLTSVLARTTLARAE